MGGGVVAHQLPQVLDQLLLSTVDVVLQLARRLAGLLGDLRVGLAGEQEALQGVVIVGVLAGQPGEGQRDQVGHPLAIEVVVLDRAGHVDLPERLDLAAAALLGHRLLDMVADDVSGDRDQQAAKSAARRICAHQHLVLPQPQEYLLRQVLRLGDHAAATAIGDHRRTVATDEISQRQLVALARTLDHRPHRRLELHQRTPARRFARSMLRWSSARIVGCRLQAASQASAASRYCCARNRCQPSQ